jgi:predicted regulator of Ras-like GTPase activity (Roadblock/LC7/MglB family)
MGATRGGTDPEEALATLTDLSAQIDGAVILDDQGAVLASSFRSEQVGSQVAAAASRLLNAARTHTGDGRSPLTHLLVETEAGAVFVARDEGKAIAAVTGTDPTVGLVFYDLKVTLREAASPPTRRSRTERKTASGEEDGRA